MCFPLWFGNKGPHRGEVFVLNRKRLGQAAPLKCSVFQTWHCSSPSNQRGFSQTAFLLFVPFFQIWKCLYFSPPATVLKCLLLWRAPERAHSYAPALSCSPAHMSKRSAEAREVVYLWPVIVVVRSWKLWHSKQDETILACMMGRERLEIWDWSWCCVLKAFLCFLDLISVSVSPIFCHSVFLFSLFDWHLNTKHLRVTRFWLGAIKRKHRIFASCIEGTGSVSYSNLFTAAIHWFLSFLKNKLCLFFPWII